MKEAETRGTSARDGASPPGWRRVALSMLGSRSRVGGDHFRLGCGSHIRAVTLDGGGQALLVANEVGDVRLYTGLFSDSPTLSPVMLLGRPGPADTYPLGYSGHPTPKYQYAAARPRGPAGGWDLVVGALTGPARMLLYERAAGAAEPLFHWPQPFLSVHGVPEFVDMKRDGRFSLLLGRADGTLLLVPPSEIDPARPDLSRGVLLAPRSREAGESGTEDHKVTGLPAAFEFPGPAMPCRVDWQGRGGRDLLVGTGDGHVLLLRDLGGAGGVWYDRGRPLAGDGGLVRVKGPACPTIIGTEKGRSLLVLDGEGVLWCWPIELRESYVTEDLAVACGVAGASIGWSVRSFGGRPMLVAGRVAAENGECPVIFDPPAPELEITPPVPALCEIHVTLHTPPGHRFRPVLRVGLSGEPFPDGVVPGESLREPDQEIHVKTADCTGRKLVFSQMAGEGSCSGGLPVFVSAIRFVPVPPCRLEPADPLPAVVAGISDTADWFRQYRLDTAEEMDAFIAMQAACGIGRLYYKLGGASWEYPSAVPGAEGVVPDLPGYPRPLTEARREQCRRLIDIAERVNRVKLAAGSCRRSGLALFGQLRLQNQGEHALHGFPIDRFFRDHPEYRDKDVWGHARWNHGLAWPEVVDFHVRIVEEAMGFGLDGILVDTLRTLPKVLYGEPVEAEFTRRHGVDMRALPPFDERVVALQGEVMERFMRAIRGAVRRVNPRGEVHLRVGRPYPLMGVDPAGLARAGLVDEILIEDRSDTPRDPDIRGLVAALAGTGCRSGAVFCRMNRWGAEVMPLDPLLVERKAREYAAAGARSVTIYESNEVPFYPELRRAFFRLKHPESPFCRYYTTD
jgi:hypothetical protein